MRGGMEWLRELEPGHVVVVRGGLAGRERRAGKVARRTPTQVIVELEGSRYELRFRAIDGREVGRKGSFYTSHLESADAAAVEEVRRESRRRELAGKFAETRWLAVPLDALERIAAIVAESQP